MISLRLAAAPVLVALPLQAGSDTRTYVPPAEPGYVYTVIRHAPVPPTGVAVQWGRWRQSARYQPEAAGEAGVVLRLRHARWDRFPLTVRTSGRIEAGPLQGEAPAQWSDPRYRKVVW
jgi:hypothetical protein